MDNEDESMEEMIKLEEDLGDQVERKESSEEDRPKKKGRDSGTPKKGKKAPDSGDSETEEPKKRKKEVKKETKKEKKTKLSFTANILNVLTTKTFSNIPPNTKFLVRFSHNILKAGCKKLSMLEKAVFYVKNSGKYKGFTLHSLDSDNVCMINTQLACMMIWTEETLENYSFCIDIKSLASLLDSANSCSYVELSSSSMDDNLKGAMLDNSVNSRIIEFTIPFETHQEEVNIKDFVAEKSVEIGSSLLASFTKVCQSIRSEYITFSIWQPEETNCQWFIIEGKSHASSATIKESYKHYFVHDTKTVEETSLCVPPLSSMKEVLQFKFSQKYLCRIMNTTNANEPISIQFQKQEDGIRNCNIYIVIATGEFISSISYTLAPLADEEE